MLDLIISNCFLDNLIALFVYTFVYNLSLLSLFWTLKQFISFNFKTIYSFTDFKFDYFFISVITVTFFSIAGIPPFVGFFSKLLILLCLLNSNFFIFFIFFFILLFFGLYFYLQNIRFLYSTGSNKLNYVHETNLRVSSLYFYFLFLLIFFLCFGIFFFDDTLLFFYWIFS